jgi:hypothetical protein
MTGLGQACTTSTDEKHDRIRDGVIFAACEVTAAADAESIEPAHAALCAGRQVRELPAK